MSRCSASGLLEARFKVVDVNVANPGVSKPITSCGSLIGGVFEHGQQKGGDR